MKTSKSIFTSLFLITAISVNAQLSTILLDFGINLTIETLTEAHRNNQAAKNKLIQLNYHMHKPATKKTQVEKDGFIGKVKQIEQSCFRAKKKGDDIIKKNRDQFDNNFMYKYNDQGYLTEEHSYNMQNELALRFRWEYDEKNNRTQQIGYTGQGGIAYTLKYENDANGNQTGQNYFTAEGKQEYAHTFLYNEKGNCIEESKTLADGTREFTRTTVYNEDGNWIEENRSGRKDILAGKFIARYDSAGNRTELEMYKPDGTLKIKSTFKFDAKRHKIEENEGENKYTWSYDDKGHKIEYNEYKGKDNTINRKFKYDEHDNLVEMVQYSSYEKKETKFSSQYEYDKEGNWIKKIEFENNKPTYIFEREIDYFL